MASYCLKHFKGSSLLMRSRPKFLVWTPRLCNVWLLPISPALSLTLPLLAASGPHMSSVFTPGHPPTPHRVFVQVVSSSGKPFPLWFISFSSFRSQPVINSLRKLFPTPTPLNPTRSKPLAQASVYLCHLYYSSAPIPTPLTLNFTFRSTVVKNSKWKTPEINNS